MRDLVQLARPDSVAEVVALVGGFSGNISYIAGGTDMVIALEQGPRPDLVIDISRMQALNFIDADIDAIHIGAATPLSTLAEHHVLAAKLPVLTQAAGQVGSLQIRNRATIGGNIASAVPGGDLLPVLKCLDCRIEVLRRDKTTTIQAFDEVVTGLGKTSLGNGDIIAAITIPLQFGANRISAFGKIGRRRELAIARLNLALLADYDSSANRINDVRIVAGALGPVPLRLRSVERQLRGRTVDNTLADDFLQALTAAVDAAIPGRISQAYKRHAVMGLGLDLLQRLFAREFSWAGWAKAPA
ncbi:MAG: molybdopterin dehydrogenase [Gammaproteobacteria bacterium]|nr:molybdopterin dehydrogenase [Gammaproteobacteria bacterium]